MTVPPAHVAAQLASRLRDDGIQVLFLQSLGRMTLKPVLHITTPITGLFIIFSMLNLKSGLNYRHYCALNDLYVQYFSI